MKKRTTMETPTPITYAQLKRSGKLKPIPGEREKWMIIPSIPVKIISKDIIQKLNLLNSEEQSAVRFEILRLGKAQRECVLLQNHLEHFVPLNKVQFA